MDHSEIPQLNCPREHCSSFIHNGFLFVMFGKAIEKKKTKPFYQIEYIEMKDLLQFENNEDLYKETLKKDAKNPWSVLNCTGEPNFQSPMLFENHEETNSFYIFGGNNGAGKSRYNRTM